MTKLALLVSACIILLSANFAAAQQADIMIGASTLLSPAPPKDVLNFQQPAEKSGTYVSVGADIVGFRKRRLGINIETAWRLKNASYPFTGKSYRPILTDVNGLFQRRIADKIGIDLFAGIGIATTRFNVPAASSCSVAGGGCINYTTSNHFMEDLGAGVRYRAWHQIFVRPEIHYYHIQNNDEFHSPNVFRVGASVGYMIGSK